MAGDVNRRLADGRCDAVIANQSLHHMLELENTFNEIARVLGRDANAGRDAECRHRAGVSPRSALRIA